MRCMFFPISGQPNQSLFCTLAFIYHYLIVSSFSWSLELCGCWSRKRREKSCRLKPKHEKLKHHGNQLRKAFNAKKSSHSGKSSTRYVSPHIIQIKSSDFFMPLSKSSSQVDYVVGRIVQEVTVILILIS